MLERDKILTILTTAIVMFVFVQHSQVMLDLGSNERILFYFSQMAYINVLFAYCFYKILKTKILQVWLWYTIGELINEVFFQGSFDYVDTIVVIISLLYYLYKYEGRKHR